MQPCSAWFSRFHSPLCDAHWLIKTRAWYKALSAAGREAQLMSMGAYTDTCWARLQPSARQTWISGLKAQYLFYAPHFTVYIDNSPLTYMMCATKFSAVGHRSVGELADFQIEVKYWPEKVNVDVDMLSRLPSDTGPSFWSICTCFIPSPGTGLWCSKKHSSINIFFNIEGWFRKTVKFSFVSRIVILQLNNVLNAF